MVIPISEKISVKLIILAGSFRKKENGLLIPSRNFCRVRSFFANLACSWFYPHVYLYCQKGRMESVGLRAAENKRVSCRDAPQRRVSKPGTGLDLSFY